MNKIYSQVWNRRQGKFVVAQENAASRGRSKRASTGVQTWPSLWKQSQR